MSRKRAWIVLACAALVVSAAAAQRPGGCCDKGEPVYDPATEVELSGRISKIWVRDTGKGWGGYHLELVSDEVTFEVHVGPDFFVEASKLELEVGDEIEIVGSRSTDKERDYLIARRITSGEESLVLRDESGRPVWAARSTWSGRT